MDKVKFGILGLGIFGEKRLIPGFKRAQNAELLAIYKRDPASARQKAEQYNIPRAYHSVQEMLADKELDALFVATPNNLHLPQVLLAAAARKHIIVEKPMALSARECGEMVTVCQKHGVELMVGQSQRFLEVVDRAREIVQGGELGKVIFANTHYTFHVERSPRSWVWDKGVAGGGPVFDLGVHCIDLLRYVLQQEVTCVHACLMPPGINPKKQVEQAATATFQFDKGTLGTMACGFNADFRTVFEFRGEFGAVWASNYTQFQQEVVLHNQREDDDQEITIFNSDPYAAEIDAFARVIAHKAENPVPGTEGLKNQQVIDSILIG